MIYDTVYNIQLKSIVVLKNVVCMYQKICSDQTKSILICRESVVCFFIKNLSGHSYRLLISRSVSYQFLATACFAVEISARQK